MARLRRGRRRGPVGGTLVLDADGLTKLARGHPLAVALARGTYRTQASIVTSASTLAEVLRGSRRDAAVHRVLADITVMPIGTEQGRAAGELLGRTGLSGHRCAMDALLAVVALAQPRPVVLLTSDVEDMRRLTEEPGRPRAERIEVARV
ncbi:MAG TPA: PIN domain-containing protein [Streptosporangiaceae bacterium]|nr:PIN domain-containing protein [Streptosporangiaceae bacterium]